MPGAQGAGSHSAGGGGDSNGPHTGRSSPAVSPSGERPPGPASHGYGGGYHSSHPHHQHSHGHPHHGYNPPGPSHLSQMIPPYTIPPAGPGSAPSSSPRSYGNSANTTPSRGGPPAGQAAPPHPHSLAHHSLSQSGYTRDGPSGVPPPPLPPVGGMRFDGDRPSSQPLLGDFGGEPSGGESLVVSPAGMDDDEDDDMQDDGNEGGPASGAAGASQGGSAGSAKRRRPHMARRRIVQSCSECRRRKIKCDKKRVKSAPGRISMLTIDRFPCGAYGLNSSARLIWVRLLDRAMCAPRRSESVS